MAAVGWQDLLPDSITTADIVDEAADRWMRQAPSPALESDQGVWLGALAGRPDLRDTAITKLQIDETLSRTLVSVFACDPESIRTLDDASPALRRNPLYWHLRVRASVLAGEIDLAAVQALQIMTGSPYTLAFANATMNPLNESYSQDRWGYRRNPIEWPDGTTVLPTVHAGTVLWMFDPGAAVARAGLGDRLETC